MRDWQYHGFSGLAVLIGVVRLFNLPIIVIMLSCALDAIQDFSNNNHTPIRQVRSGPIIFIKVEAI